MLVWAANDNVFHVEVKKPIIIHDDVGDNSHCDGDKVIGKDLLESLNLDSTQFSASWLKKEFIEKVADLLQALYVLLFITYRIKSKICHKSVDKDILISSS